MMPARRWLGPAAVATLLVALAVGAALLRSGGADHPVPDPAPALAELAELRAAVDRCALDLAAEQERFHAHERTVDSLRAAVSGYESEGRTVAAGEFEEYLEAFTAYNQSVEAWHERAEALRAGWEECHDLSARHNALVDSLSGPPPASDSPGRRGQGTGSGSDLTSPA
jgi:hypothetical protein